MSVRADVRQALADWNAGKPVRSIELGHTQKQVTDFSGGVRILQEQHHPQNQERAHAYAFALIEQLSKNEWSGTHEEFRAICDTNALLPMLVENGLSPEERDGAESLAWKALLVGWKRAIAGHKEEQYIEVSREGVQA